MPGLLDELSPLWPALGFLLAGVPLANLLERLGFFDSVATAVVRDGRIAVSTLWLIAAATTIVLNLDTTIVLLTPLYLRIARRAGVDPVPLVAIPLLLAGLASSVLPISNLTTLIAAERLDIGVADVVGHLGLASVAAITVGWWAYRRRHAGVVEGVAPGVVDRRALRLGGLIVVALLAGFVAGPAIGIDPWVTVLAADAVLIGVTRHVPWRHVPVTTALGVAAVAAIVAIAVPSGLVADRVADVTPWALPVVALVAAAVANAVNNLPALLSSVDGAGRMTWGGWSWLLGVNAGAVLLPMGALANLLWLRIVRDEGVEIGVRRYAAVVVPVALPAFLAAAAVLALAAALG